MGALFTILSFSINKVRENLENFISSSKVEEEIVQTSNLSICFDPILANFDLKDSDYDESTENETSSFNFKFHLLSSEEIIRSNKDSEASTGKETTITKPQRCCFEPEKNFADYIEDQEIVCFNCEESDSNSLSKEEVHDYRYRDNLHKKFEQQEIVPASNASSCFDSILETFKPKDSENVQIAENETSSFKFKFQFQSSEEISRSIKELEATNNNETPLTNSKKNYFQPETTGVISKDSYIDSKSNSFSIEEACDDKFEGVLGRNFKELDSEKVLHDKQVKNGCTDTFEEPSKSDTATFGNDHVPAIETAVDLEISTSDQNDCEETETLTGSDEEIQKTEETHLKSSCTSDAESIYVTDEFSGGSKSQLSDAESQGYEDAHCPVSGVSGIEFSVESQLDDFMPPNKIPSEKGFDQSRHETKENDGSQNYNENHLLNPSTLDLDHFIKLDSLWERQEVVKKVSYLRKIKATLLPTILEEDESQKTIEDLKSWTMNDCFLQENPMDELQKFFKSYRERMKKFDILNSMYPIDFQLIVSKKRRVSRITSFLSQQRRKSDRDPKASVLETVYVGQACLSWEFLHWQYNKSCDSPESDPPSHCRYNQVAGDFQHFQVLVQRFLENEPFEGPRVQNYVKSRHLFPNLLQIPAIKEDCLEVKMGEESEENKAITREMLTEIMEKSIRIFWDFIKADRNKTNVILEGFFGTQMELQDPADLKLLKEIRADLETKKKLLKNLFRTRNGLLRRFQKHQEDKSSDYLIFFTEVDMKLVSRVLKMSRITTDQLLWCQKKLNRITFRERKIVREPSFSLFPC